MERPNDLNNLFYLYPFPSWVYDLQSFRILEVNQAAIDHYGYSRSEFLSLDLQDLRPPHTIPELHKAHENVEQGNRTIFLGVRTHQKKSGEIIRVKINGHKLYYEKKECIMAVCQDVTAEENRLNQLQDSERRLSAATNIAKLGYWRLEPDANTLTWTDEVYQIWNVSKETFAVSFQNFMDTVHPLDRADFEKVQKECFTDDKLLDYVHRILLPDGSVKWVHELGRIINDAEGKMLAFEGTVQDITLRKQEEQRMKLLESVVTNTTDAVLITEAAPLDEPGPRIIYANEAFTTLTGYTAAELTGLSPRILQGPKTDKSQVEILSRALRNNESCDVTLINYKKNGQEFWNHLTISPVNDAAGHTTHFIAIERDVTEQKNKELENELFGNISRAFHVAGSYENAAGSVCEALCSFGQFDLVEIWAVNTERTHLQHICHHVAEPAHEVFYKDGPKQFLKSQGLPGQVWQHKAQVLLTDITTSNDFVRKQAAAKLGLLSVLGIPLMFNNQVVGVAVVGSRKPAEKLEKYKRIFFRLQDFIGSEMNRKKLEDELYHLYDAIPDIVCLVDLDGRFLKINQAGCDLLGYREDEILFHDCQHLVHPHDKHLSDDAIKRLTQGENIVHFENRYFTRAGQMLWLSWTSKSDTEKGVIYATAKNITEEKKLKELHEQASQLAKIGTWEIDLVQQELYWSEVMHSLHETSAETYVPDLASGIEFYRQEFRDVVRYHINQCVEHGLSFDFEAVIVTQHKKERWIRAIGNAERVDGETRRIYGSFQDIHERKEAELRLQSLADNLPGVVFQYVLKADGTDELRFVTKGASQVWGFAPEDVVANNQLVWDQIAVAGELPKVQESILDAITQKKKWNARFKYRMPGGELRTHAGYGTPQFLADGTTVFNSVILDVTREAKNEELLQQSTTMARIGSWELNMGNDPADDMYWSPMTKSVLE
ncbi:MAG: PAS domain S-box protein, partial [Sphingobacteriales bacterium]